MYGGNFRSGNAFANLEDMQSKAGQARVLQDELGRQIEVGGEGFEGRPIYALNPTFGAQGA